jgi:hypothetical protein
MQKNPYIKQADFMTQLLTESISHNAHLLLSEWHAVLVEVYRIAKQVNDSEVWLVLIKWVRNWTIVWQEATPGRGYKVEQLGKWQYIYTEEPFAQKERFHTQENYNLILYLNDEGRD